MALVDGIRARRPLTLNGPAMRNLSDDQAPGFGAFYDDHIDGVWRLLERLGVASSAIEDATQDVFVIAHRRMNEFRGDSSLRTWVTGIALRVAKDYRRSVSRRGHLEPIEEALHLEARARPDDQAESNEALRHVLELTEQLDESQRLVFTLVEFEGFTVPEVAQLTGVKANTLSTRLRAARARFNELVELHHGGLR